MRNTWLRWACLSLCYLAFAGHLSRSEGVAAVLTGAFGALLSWGLRTKAESRLSLHGRWPAVLGEVLVQLARDLVRVGVMLSRALLRGRTYRGHVVHEREPAELPVGEGAGRRAAAALITSLTPDSVALDTAEDAQPVHRLWRPARAGNGAR